jgi:hypothetical protein
MDGGHGRYVSTSSLLRLLDSGAMDPRGGALAPLLPLLHYSTTIELCLPRSVTPLDAESLATDLDSDQRSSRDRSTCCIADPSLHSTSIYLVPALPTFPPLSRLQRLIKANARTADEHSVSF